MDLNFSKKLRKTIRDNASPRHVPNKIYEVQEIPYTINGKKVEVAVKQTILNQKIKNKDSLVDAYILDYYKNLKSHFQLCQFFFLYHVFLPECK